MATSAGDTSLKAAEFSSVPEVSDEGIGSQEGQGNTIAASILGREQSDSIRVDSELDKKPVPSEPDHAPTLSTAASRNTADVMELTEQHSTYHKRRVSRRALIRLPPILITMTFEVIRAVVYANGATLLVPLIGQEKAALFIGLNSLICAVSGNLALQNASNVNRWLAIGIVTKNNWKVEFRKELRVSVLLCLTAGLLLGAIAGLIICPASYGGVDAGFGTVVFLSMVVSGFVGCVCGWLAPVALTYILKVDPALAAGPGENCFQDVFGAVVIIYMAYGLFHI